MFRRIFIIALFAFLAFAPRAFAYTDPGAPSGYVNDFAGILAPSDKSALEAKLAAFEQKTGDEIAIAIVPSLGGDTVENYAVRLFQDWGIGKKNVDNGVLVLVSTGDHEARIEVGYGLEPTVTDADSSVILRDTMLPDFKKGDYAAGLNDATDRIISLIEGDPGAVSAASQSQGSDAGALDFWTANSGFLIFIFFIIGWRLLAVMARTKSWWLGGVIGLVVGFILIGLVGALACAAIGLAVDFVVSRWGANWFKGRGGPGGPWFFGGGGFGGGRGGGFGGFGGGLSGGGGASGRW